jgi:hypothetical protein
MEGVSLLEILIWEHYKGRGKFVGDFNMGNIICVKILSRLYADNVTHIKISNKLTPSIDYFLNFI